MAATPKVVHQLRRAQQIANVALMLWPAPAKALAAIELIDDWAGVSKSAGVPKPSEDTVALAVELLRQRAEQTEA